MAWRFTGDRPVYIQLADRITKSVLSGVYSPGAQLPTVRQLAMEAAVNPNTVQHAFTHLEHEGLIVSRGTLGRFVTEDRQVIQAIRKEVALQLAKAFSEEMNQLSMTPEEIVKLIQEVSL